MSIYLSILFNEPFIYEEQYNSKFKTFSIVKSERKLIFQFIEFNLLSY